MPSRNDCGSVVQTTSAPSELRSAIAGTSSIKRSAPSGSRVERGEHRAGMVPVPVREHDALDLAEVCPQPSAVSLEGEILRATVEKHAVAAGAPRRREQGGESMDRAAQAAPG